MNDDYNLETVVLSDKEDKSVSISSVARKRFNDNDERKRYWLDVFRLKEESGLNTKEFVG